MRNLLLCGDREILSGLLRGDSRVWGDLLNHVLDSVDDAAPATVIDTMLDLQPDVLSWLDMAHDASRVLPPEVRSRAREQFREWFCRGVRLRWGEHHPSRLWLRLDELLSASSPGDLESARSLVADSERPDVPASLRSQALLCFARHAAEGDRIDEAIEATRAARSVDPSVENEASRQEGALLLRGRRVEEALACLERVMGTRGPLFGVATSLHSDDAEPLERALREAATVAMWASHTTPEWVRALGGIAEHGGVGWDTFERTLASMVDASSHPIDDLEVVARQARQRDMTRTARTAAEASVVRFPLDRTALDIAAPYLIEAGEHDRVSRLFEAVAEQTALSEAERALLLLRASEVALAGGRPGFADELLARAWRWLPAADRPRAEILQLAVAIQEGGEAALDLSFEKLNHLSSDPREFIRPPVLALIELTIRALVSRHDRRAVTLHERLLDAKRQLWGDSPSVWLEQHRLAITHAALGETEECCTLLTESEAALRRLVGADHPDTRRVAAELARVRPMSHLTNDP